MTENKLAAALRRHSEREPEATITLIERIGRSVRTTSLHIAVVMQITKDRSDFVGHGTGRRVRSIEHKPIDRTAKWEECWRNSQASVMAFWGEERSAT